MLIPLIGGSTLSAGLYYILHRQITDRTSRISSDLRLTSQQLDPDLAVSSQLDKTWAQPPPAPLSELIKASWNSTIDGLFLSVLNFDLNKTQSNIMATTAALRNRLAPPQASDASSSQNSK